MISMASASDMNLNLKRKADEGQSVSDRNCELIDIYIGDLDLEKVKATSEQEEEAAALVNAKGIDREFKDGIEGDPPPPSEDDLDPE